MLSEKVFNCLTEKNKELVYKNEKFDCYHSGAFRKDMNNWVEANR